MSQQLENGLVISKPMDLREEWIDYNGHLNMAYYNVLFDTGVDVAFEMLGLGPDYATSRKLTTYTAEIHVSYLREIHLGDKVQVTFQLVDHDEKRLHIFQELRHQDGWISATCEVLALHVDMSGPKVAPFPKDIWENVEAMAKSQAELQKPEGIGKSIGIRRKKA